MIFYKFLVLAVIVHHALVID